MHTDIQHKISLSLFLLPLLFISLTSLSQDTIYLKSGERKITTIKEIYSDSIIYKDTSEGIKSSIRKDKISRIDFSDGHHEFYLYQKNVKLNFDTIGNLYNIGRYNAKRYYNTTPAFIGSFCLTSVVSIGLAAAFNHEATLLIGPIGSAIIFFTPPDPYHIAPWDKNLSNPDYYKGYKKEARKKKRLAVLGGFLTGLAADVLLFAIISR